LNEVYMLEVILSQGEYNGFLGMSGAAFEDGRIAYFDCAMRYLIHRLIDPFQQLHNYSPSNSAASHTKPKHKSIRLVSHGL
jgi:hypothetical protein